MFLDNMQAAALQVGILYVMVFIGFLACKLKIFPEKTANDNKDLLFYVITVCVIVRSFADMEFNPETASSFLIALGCNFLTFIIGIVITIPILKKKNHPDNPVYRYSAIYSNAGYMALPLASAILGTEGVFYC